MKLNLPKDWKKILIWGVGIIIFTVIIFLYSKYESDNYDTKTSYTSTDKDRIEIGEPKYVEYEEINTNDSYYQNDDKSKYSQIQVKNTSDDTIYALNIELKEQEMKEPSGLLVPSYYIDVLAPGESAILSSKHENIKENEKLEINEYSYSDGNGTSYRVTKYFEEGKIKFGIHSENNDKLYKFNDVSSEVDIVSVKVISEKEENNTIYYEMEIKNNSNINIRDIYLDFNELYNNSIIGSSTKIYEGTLKPGKTIISKFDSKRGVKLDMVSYGYNTYDESSKNKVITYYNIYVKQGKYDTFEYEDYESSSRKRVFLSISNLVVISIFWILDSMAKKMQTKGTLEGNEVYIIRGKNIIKVKNILFVSYIILLIVSMFLY